MEKGIEKKSIRLSNLETNKKTKESIRLALLQLLEEKEMPSITISEVVRTAGVSRVAFYNNYESKFAVIKDIIDVTNKEILEPIGRPFSKEVDKEWYQNVFKVLKEKADVIRIICKANFLEAYIDSINELILKRDDISSTKIKYERLLWNGGFQNLVGTWIKDGMIEPTEEMAEICFHFFHKSEDTYLK